jgi:hypothetical protein
LPYVASGAEFDRIADRLERLSKPYGAAVGRKGNALEVRRLGD